MDEKILLSVIIPAYNSAKYLPECLESFLIQIDKSTELIVIDDGSTDDTSKICDEYAKNSKYIKIFHTKNQGVSAARNYGLKKASGKFVWFVDSDDKVSPTAVKTILDKIKTNDSLIFGIEEFDKKSSRKIQYDNKTIDSKTAIERALSDNDFRGYLFNKIFKLDIIKNNNLHFDADIKVCEDLLFCIQYFSLCESVKIISNVLYYYRQRIGSAVHQKINKNQSTSLVAFHNIIKLCDSHKEAKVKAEALFMRAFYKYKPILNKTELANYQTMLKNIDTNLLKFPKKDLTIILGYRFFNPIMKLIQNKKTNSKGSLYE